MAKVIVARKSLGPKRPCGSDSRPGHERLCKLFIFQILYKVLFFCIPQIWSHLVAINSKLLPISLEIEHRCILFSVVVQTILIYRSQRLLCCRVILLDIGI